MNFGQIYCNMVCLPIAERLKKKPPCKKCVNKCPDLVVENMVIHSLMLDLYESRSANGGIEWSLFFKILELEGFSHSLQLELYQQARLIQQVMIKENNKKYSVKKVGKSDA